jgi:hypothetical protein
MSFNLTDIFTEEEMKKMPSTMIEGINSYYYKKIKEMEDINTKKFEDLVESITNKFDTQVNNAIIESARVNTGNLVNEKLYTIVKDIANLLENSGISTTEKTKELRHKLKVADEQLEKSYEEREVIKEQLTDEMKKNLIYNKLQGMKPEIIHNALEYFKDKDVREVTDEAIDMFLSGDFTDLLADAVESDDFGSDISLDKIRDALEEIDEERAFEKSDKIFENLSKGINKQKVISPNVTKEDLNTLIESTEVIDSDVKDALEKIDEYKGFGYKFQ